MNTTGLIGLDFSLTSPGLTFAVRDEISCFGPFTDKQYKIVNTVQSEKDVFIGCLLDPSAIKPDQFESHEDRELFLAYSIAYAISKLVNMHSLETIHVAIEGYSFGSKFSQAHKIGEATGCVIAIINQLGDICPTLKTVKFYRPSPQEVKKSVGGKIKDGKEGVYVKFVEATGIDLITILDTKKLKSPISDLTDSWACYIWLKTKLDNQIQENDNVA